MENQTPSNDVGLVTSEIQNVMWTLGEGIAFVRSVNLALKDYGYCAALGGGVLNKGFSNKDLDVVLLPFKTSQSRTISELHVALNRTMNLKAFEPRDPWYVGDEKIVYTCDYFGKRVDLFFLT